MANRKRNYSNVSTVDPDLVKPNISNFSHNLINKDKNYFSIDEYNGIKFSENSLSILSLNINSLKKHVDEFVALLKSLNNKPDIIILSEIRNNIEEIVNYNFTNYVSHTTYPENNKCGGILILVKNTIKHDVVHNKSINTNSIENLVIKVHLKDNPIYVSGIYKHPNVNLNEFKSIMKKHIRSIPQNYTLIIAGDINIDLLKANTDTNITVC